MGTRGSAQSALVDNQQPPDAGLPSPSPVVAKGPGRRSTSLSRDKILLVATRIFAEHGYAGTSIRDIARDCDITLPSIYHFFGDKQNLYRQCLDTTFSATAHRLLESLLTAKSASVRVLNYTVVLCEGLRDRETCRLLQHSLLADDRLGVERLAQNLPPHFGRFALEIGAMDSVDDPGGKAFSIYALTIGLAQIRRVGESAGFDCSMFDEAQGLALHVLQIILPAVDWLKLAKAKVAKGCA